MHVAPLLTLTHLAAYALGYGACVVIERRRQRRRESVLRGLGAELPDWETAARQLEARAHKCVTEMPNLDTALRAARGLRAEADITRKRGRQRDREWR